MNLFEIQQDLLSIFDELEANGGEITPELEEKLSITQESFKDKIESYTNYIKELENDTALIKAEQIRLKELADRKNKTANKLKSILINAVNQFGDTKKSGVKYVDYGIGEVSIRKTQVVKVDDNLVNRVKTVLQDQITFDKETNQLDVIDRVDSDSIIDIIEKDIDNEINVNSSDLDHIDVDLSVSIPFKDLANGQGYNVLKELAKYTDIYKLDTSVSKTKLKAELKENGACAPNLAKLEFNEILTIK